MRLSAARRLKAREGNQTMDGFLSVGKALDGKPPRSPFPREEPLGGNGANAVLIETDGPLSPVMVKGILQSLDEEYPGSYTVRARRLVRTEALNG